MCKNIINTFFVLLLLIIRSNAIDPSKEIITKNNSNDTSFSNSLTSSSIILHANSTVHITPMNSTAINDKINTENTSNTFASIDIFKEKIDGLKKKLSEKINQKGLPNEKITSIQLINQVLGNRKIQIVILCFLCIAVMFLIAIQKPSQKKQETIDKTIFIGDEYSNYSKTSSVDRQLGLKGRNLLLNKATKYSAIQTPTLHTNHPTLNYSKQTNQGPRDFKDLLNAKYAAMSSNVNSNNQKMDFSFAFDTKNFNIGRNLNETVDFEEREEYTNIINFLDM